MVSDEFDSALVDQAEEKDPPGLIRRSVPEATNSFLRCQLGRYVTETREIGGRGELCHLFLLVAYGNTWSEAVGMIRQRDAARIAPQFAVASN